MENEKGCQICGEVHSTEFHVAQLEAEQKNRRREFINKLCHLDDETIRDIIEKTRFEDITATESFANIYLGFSSGGISEARLEDIRKNKYFTEAVRKYPLLDLAAGEETFLDGLLEVMAQGKFGLRELIAVDTHLDEKRFTYPSQDQSREIETIDVKVKKADMLTFLRTLPAKSFNILLGGFGTEICHPNQGEEDKYRAALLAEFVRVVPDDGFALVVSSKISGEYDRAKITPSDLGFIVGTLTENDYPVLEDRPVGALFLTKMKNKEE